MLKWLVLMLLTMSALSIQGCRGCSRAEKVAELTELQGTIERDYARAIKEWQRAQVGSEFHLGDAVKSSKASEATLLLSDSSSLKLQSETTVRFSDVKPGTKEQGINVEAGTATLEVGASELMLRLHTGVARLDANTRVSIVAANNGVRFSVIVGLARFEDKDQLIEVAAGRSIAIGVGLAVLEPEVPAPSPEIADVPSTPAPLSGDISADVRGRGAKAKTSDKSGWVSLAEGQSSLPSGSQLKLSSGTSVDIKRGDQAATLRGAGTFTIGEGEVFVRTIQGQSSVRASGSDVIVSVPGGVIVVQGGQGGSTAALSTTGKRSTVKAVQGRVEVRTDSGSELLLAGQNAEIDAKGAVDVEGRGPPLADMRVPLGSSFIVHDPSPPTIVGIEFTQACPGAGVLELMRGGKPVALSRGEGSANLAFAAGAGRYQVRCLTADGISESVAGSGTITVIRDSGTAQLPRLPPATLVDTDGRHYTVLYQNLLPKLTVRWPSAPKDASYTLKLNSSSGKEQVFTSRSPSYALKAGSVGEGSHTLTFLTSSGLSSPKTALTINFDNAAPKASISAPANGSFAPGSSVAASGVAETGWEVSAGGQSLTMDEQHRFSGTVSAGERAIAFRFSHPRRGLHYYIRRAAGAK